MAGERVTITAATGCHWHPGQDARAPQRINWNQNKRRIAATSEHWQLARPQPVPLRGPWRQNSRIETVPTAIIHTPAAPVALVARLPWFGVVALQQTARLVWQKTAPKNGFVQCIISAPWYGVLPLRRDARIPWQTAGKTAQNWRIKTPGTRALALPVRLRWRDCWHWPRPGHWSSNPDPYTPDPPYPPQPPEPPGGLLVIPLYGTYVVIHQAKLYRVDTGAPIHAESLTISLDADSWAWQFSARILGADSLAAVTPNANGDPVIIAAELNGYDWQFLVDGWQEDRQFRTRTATLTGRGLTAELAAPWQLPGSGIQGERLTVRQLLESHLPQYSGWRQDWHAESPDWLVPADTWQWADKTPILAIHEAATGCGFILNPARAERAYTIQPRYPVLPWHFESATPDLEIPDAAILSIQRAASAPTQANAVFVHGTATGGILGHVVREGSAGDRLAATQSHALITAVEAARLLGSRILAGNHEQPALKSLTTTLGGDFPLAELGWLLAAEIDGEVHRGIINAVRVECNAAQSYTVRQTVTIGEETPNIWAKFHTLTPSAPLQLGTVERTHPDGTVTVRLASGGALRARGNAATGEAVFVRNKILESTAPAMPQTHHLT